MPKGVYPRKPRKGRTRRTKPPGSSVSMSIPLAMLPTLRKPPLRVASNGARVPAPVNAYAQPDAGARVTLALALVQAVREIVRDG